MRKNYVRFMTALLVAMSFSMSILAQSHGFDLSNMDRSANACDDFFEFANGNWVKNTAIPPSQSRWGNFNILAESNRDVLKKLLDETPRNAPAGSDAQMTGDFYRSCMNEAAIEKAGISPLNPFLKQINSMKTIKDVQHQLAVMHTMGIPVLFGFGSGPDLKNSSLVIANAGQGGLSLPNKDYYTKDDDKSKETRA
jgi:putative endopeptidase